MKKSFVFLALFLIFVTACASQTPIQTQVQQTPVTTTAVVAANTTMQPTSNLKPQFKVIREYAVRSPATVTGTVENIGMGTGSAQVLVQVYYAQEVSSEQLVTLSDIEPQGSANFSVSFNQTVQWNAYNVTVQPVTS